MNKILMWISFLLWSILVIVNYISAQPILFINRADNWTVVFIAILIWVMAWVWIKWFLNEKSSDNYNDNEWVNF